jgi:hypothetical protein
MPLSGASGPPLATSGRTTSHAAGCPSYENHAGTIVPGGRIVQLWFDEADVLQRTIDGEHPGCNELRLRSAVAVASVNSRGTAI